MVLCFSIPSTYIALKGRAGQTYSHAPHPMQRSVSIIGIIGTFLSPSFFFIIFIAPFGQWRSQLLHVTLSLFAMQLSEIHTAVPILMELFCSVAIGFIALLGQISAQTVHVGRQNPRSNDISGCINLSRLFVGLSTLFGHFDTHNWHAVQCVVNLFRLSEPGGTIGVVLRGIFLFSIIASPPSTFLFACAKSELVAIIALVDKNSRLLSFLYVGVLVDLLRPTKLYVNALCLQWSMQFMHVTQRL